MKRRVVVIGAGLGGLSAACHLAGAGYEVTVVEAADVPGGRAGSATIGGYRFDTGPTVLTMPELIDRCFEAAGSDRRDYLDLKPVDPMYRACYADGSHLLVHHGRDAMRDEIASVCGEAEATAFVSFCSWLERLYRVEMGSFIERNYDSPIDLLRPLGPAIDLLRLSALRRLTTVVNRTFADDRLRRLFSFQALYAGVAPYQALAIYAVISYMDVVNGVFTPAGGMHALPVAMAAAAEKAGATFRYRTRAQRVVLRDRTQGPVTGVRLETGEVLAADAVVANPDLAAVYRSLVPDLPAPRALRRARYSPSALVWHVGGPGFLPRGAAHHNIHFGHAWEDSFRNLIDQGRRMPDPSLLISVPTMSEPSMAPPGRHVLYVLEPVPHLGADIDWSTERDRARDQLAARVARYGYDITPDVEKVVDPLDWQSQGLERGTPFALAHTFGQTGPFRPRNIERRAPGLVFVGSSTVPGVGVPMVLVSGMLAAQRVTELARA